MSNKDDLILNGVVLCVVVLRFVLQSISMLALMLAGQKLSEQLEAFQKPAQDQITEYLANFSPVSKSEPAPSPVPPPSVSGIPITMRKDDA